MSRYQGNVDVQDLIVSLAASRQGMNNNEICGRYGVSRRTAERMRSAIAERFPLVEVTGARGDRQKRWRIPPLATVGLLAFGPTEVEILAEAAKKLSLSGHDSLAERVTRIAERIRLLH